MKVNLLLLVISFFSVQDNAYSNNTNINLDSNNMKIEEVFDETDRLKNVNTDIQKSVSGIITDANGAALPGANIIVKGTSNGSQTDFDGKYSISNVADNDILVVSYIGFVSQEVAVNGRTTVNITLVEDTQSLNEIVVVAYGTATKKDLTGAVSVISSEELTSFPTATVDQALQGKTAGVQITSNSGAPGASATVNIRGVGSFGSTTPLYVVDGFPTNDISFVNPSTIESISVLKDASATALYGVRASNGVVIIQTKQGTKGKVAVELSSFLAFRSKPKSIDVLDANQFSSLALGLSGSSDVDVAGNAIPYSGWSNPGDLRTINWQDEVFSKGTIKSTTLSVRGGGENSRYAVTAGIFDDEGTLIGSEYKRYDLGLNGSFDITDKLRFKANAKYISSQNFQPLGTGRGALLNLYASVPHLAPTGEANQIGGTNPTNLPVDANGNFGAFPDVTGEAFRDGRNWVARALENDQDNVSNTVLANMSAEWDIYKGLSTRLNLGARSDNFAGWNFSPEYYRSSGNVDLRNRATYKYTQDTSNQWLAEYILQYKKTFAEKHSIDVLGGISVQRTFRKFSEVEGSGFLDNRIRDIAQAAEITDAAGFSTRQTLASTFARFNYSFDSKYYFTGTIRRDGVGDTFGADNLWGVFPSFAVGWNIDEENFMQDSAFDILKLRASWGETGNFQGIQPYRFSTTFNNGTPNNDSSYSFAGNNAAGLAPVGASNPNLTWEAQVQTNIGLEGELLNNRLYFTADYFNRTSEDFLLFINSPSQSGFPIVPVNGGTIVNKGFELLVGYRKNDGDFNFDINGNISFIDNEITELNVPNGEVTFSNQFLNDFFTGGFWYDITKSQLGGEAGSFYGFVADGLFQNQAEIDALNTASPDGTYQSTRTSPGDRRFVDLNNDGEITDQDRTVIGSPVPDFFGSLNLNFSYKNFDLGLNFYGSYGSEIFNLVKRELESASGYGNSASYSNVSTEYFNNIWSGEGSTNAYARALIDDGDIQNNRASSYFVEDGSYLRLRNLNIGYTLPSKIVEKLRLDTFRIYTSIQNVFTITNYSGSDPEIGQNADINGNSNVTTRGIDAGAYPVSSTVTLGFNLKF
ncbi:TonB-dependent receptor [Flavivirga abyssicola]|uniref:SusC/RagA family TonB-linked outer membrane protein n=1 Tax=Flavivirga abyssicola TaxID=3063533 RepID=UPI0026E018FB|nr:TonB-dependent receptor [Flavivirga sp. MEBiC07777]WVK13164.1 TonB-dependent receptor [Flavivirga sp. MEBiC07777]